MAKSKNRKNFGVIGSGFVPCNKIRWRNARLVLYRPGYGIVSLEFDKSSVAA